MTDGPSIPAGWYPDALRPGWARWWDGRQWTDRWAPIATPVTTPEHTPVGPVGSAPSASTTSWWSAPTPPTMASPTTAAARRRSRTGLVLVAIGALAVATAVGAVVWSGVRDAGTTSDASETRRSDGRDESNAGDGPGATPSRLLETCGTSDLLSIPGTDITIEPMTLEQEIEIGEETRELVFDVYTASDDTAIESMLAGLLDELRPPASPVPYSTALLDSTEVNAFAIPGGDIYFTTGIVELMSEDELAFVVAHEIAHVECRHLPQQFEREALVAAGLSVVLDQEIAVEDLYANAAGGMLTSLASLSFSRDDEREADQAALELLEAAERPLTASVDALRVLLDLEAEVESSRIDVLLSTHPPTQDRIDALDAAIENRS